jgi:hypothetical protein
MTEERLDKLENEVDGHKDRLNRIENNHSWIAKIFYGFLALCGFLFSAGIDVLRLGK